MELLTFYGGIIRRKVAIWEMCVRSAVLAVGWQYPQIVEVQRFAPERERRIGIVDLFVKH